MKKQKLLRRILAIILSTVMVLGGPAATVRGEALVGAGEENAAPGVQAEEPAEQKVENSADLPEVQQPDSYEVKSVSGAALMRGARSNDYQINEDFFEWSEGEQTITLSGSSDTLTIVNALPEGAKATIEVTSPHGSDITIAGNVSEVYTNVCITVQQDINLTLDNLKIVAPETFGGGYSFPALAWFTSGGAAALIVSGECSLTGSRFSSAFYSRFEQQLTITGAGGSNDSLTVWGGSDTKPVLYEGQTVGDGINMYGPNGAGAKLTIRDVTLNATGGNDMGGYGTAGSGISIIYGNLEIIDATVNVTSGTDSHPTKERIAIDVGGNAGTSGNLTITNSTVTVRGSDSASSVGDYGIRANGRVTVDSGTVKVYAGSSASNNGGRAINAAEMTVNGGAVTAVGGDSGSKDGGNAIFLWPGELLVTGGTVTATGGRSTSTNGGVAIYAGTLQLSGGTVTATGGDGYVHGIHGIFVAQGVSTIETGANLTAIGGKGSTGAGGVGLRSYGEDNTVTVANSAGDVYIRGGQGATEQNSSILGGNVYIATGNIGSIRKESTAGALSIKNAPGGDPVYMVSVRVSPISEAVVRSVVGSGTTSEYTYHSKADQSGSAILWLPAGDHTLRADDYNDTNTRIETNHSNTAVLGQEAEVTAHNSAELQTYMAASYVTTINLVNGVTYQYTGGTVSRDLTIKGNGAVIEAGAGVSDTIIRSDDITVSSTYLPNYTGVKTFLRVEGTGSALKLQDVVLRNGINKNGTDNREDGLFTVINVKTGGSLVLDNTTLRGFHNNPVKGNNLSFGIHAEPGALSTIIKNSRFESSNAFRNAIAIRSGALQIERNTFYGTDYPDLLRQSDGYEYAMYIYGGNGTVMHNTIEGYDNTTQLGYASAGISVVGFYSTQVIIKDNTLSYNESGIDITGTWSPYSSNTHMSVNGILLTTGETAYIIGETLRADNSQDYVSVSQDQNNEVEMVDSTTNKQYYPVYGGYRSPWITLGGNEGGVVTLRFPETERDTLRYADIIRFEAQVDGGATWSEVPVVSMDDLEASLSLDGGHDYIIRVRLTHRSYVEVSDPIERTLITYSNPITLTVPSGDSEIGSILSKPISTGAEAGTRTAPKTASIEVLNAVSVVTAGDILKNHAGATVTFYGTDGTFTTAAATASLTENGATTVYIKVTAQNNTAKYYAVSINRAGSSNTGITSILGQVVTTGGEAGTIAAPKAASINVANGVSTVAVGNILKSHAGATAAFYGTDSTFVTPEVGTVALTPGADTTVYIKVTAQDRSTIRYYAVTIRRAPSSSSPDPAPGPGPVVVPGTGAATEKVEIITVDVKQGETDNTVAQISIDRTTHSDGSKSDLVTYQKEKAQETIEKLKEEGKDLARILIPGSDGAVSKTQVMVPSASLNALAEGKVNLQIDTVDAKIEIPKASLALAEQRLGEDLFFHLVPVKKDEEKREVTQRAIMEVSVISNQETTNIFALGIPMTIETNMPSSDVDITLPLSGIKLPENTVEREAFLRQLAVYIEHSDGDKELVQGEIVEYRSGIPGIRFHINKFSTFTIVKLEKSSACEVIKVTAPVKAKLKGSKITATVENTTGKLTVKVTVSDKASWKLYSDKACRKELKNQKLILKVGANKVYLRTTAEDGDTSKIYTVTIVRQELPKQLIIIANRYDFADAFVGGVPALQSGGEVITTGIEPEDAKKLVAYIKKNYTKQDRIYILGLEKAVYKDLEKLLLKEGYTDVLRIGGKDKYETARQTAGIVKLSEKARVILVNGTVKPEDAESIQRQCAEKGYPILLVQKDNLTTATLEALKKIKPVRVYILGNTATISAKVANQVKEALKLKDRNIVRIKSGDEIK